MLVSTSVAVLWMVFMPMVFVLLVGKIIRVQAELAIDEADVIVFVVDGKDDLGPNDYLIKDMLV